MDQRIDTGAVLPGFRSFPLDRARRFAGDVQHHPIHSLHLIDDAVRVAFGRIPAKHRRAIALELLKNDKKQVDK